MTLQSISLNVEIMEIQMFPGRDFTNEDSTLVRPVPAGMLASMVGFKGSKGETSLNTLYGLAHS